MTFKPSLWHPIAVASSALNLVGLGYAAGAAEPLHAAGHSVLALAFGLWAVRLRQSRAVIESRAELGAGVAAGLDALEIEVSRLRQELSEAQERLDFAERLLAQKPEARRVEPR